MKKFEYKKSEKFSSPILIALLVSASVTIIYKSNYDIIAAILVSMFILPFIIFVASASASASTFERFSIDKQGISVYHTYKVTYQIEFEEIRRVVIQENIGTYGHDEMTIFHANSAKRIITSDLIEPYEFTNLIEKEAGNFKVIYQNAEGEIIRTLPNKKRK